MFLLGIHIQPAQHQCTCLVIKQCEIISIQYMGYMNILCASYCPPHTLSNRVDIINENVKKGEEKKDTLG
eukprot:1137098-Pelagomonas_calceolata.AAC.3